jgi:ribosomal protein S5
MMAALPAQRVAEQHAVQVLLDSAPKGYGLRLDGELIALDGSDL